MNEHPLTHEELRDMIASTKKGEKKTVYLCWYAPRAWIVTRVWLMPESTINSRMLGNVNHDYEPDDVPSSHVVHHINPDWAYYDNYWFAYRHVLLKNKEREHA